MIACHQQLKIAFWKTDMFCIVMELHHEGSDTHGAAPSSFIFKIKTILKLHPLFKRNHHVKWGVVKGRYLEEGLLPTSLLCLVYWTHFKTFKFKCFDERINMVIRSWVIHIFTSVVYVFLMYRGDKRERQGKYLPILHLNIGTIRRGK